MWTIAIGDIHGHAEKLSALIVVVERWRAEHAASQETQLIFLGDYIDRGPHSAEVLQTVRALQAAGAVCLRGNHEDLMIHSVETELDRQNFLINGGGETCRSLGSVEAFDDAREWMLELPLFHEDAHRYFVHAGVRPGLMLHEQSPKDQMWIRDLFLSYDQPFERYIVHGHTPIKTGADLPDVRSNRCNLDTGAGHSGPLSAAVFADDHPLPVYLMNSEGKVVTCELGE